jgi:tight adherence protein C
MVTLLAQTQANDPITFIVPLLFAVCVGLGAYLLVSFFMGRKSSQLSRLERFGRLGRAGAVDESNPDRLQALLEKTAPALAKPLTSSNEQELSDLKVYLLNAGWHADNNVAMYNGIRFAALMTGMVLAAIFVLPVYGFTQNGMIYSFVLTALFFYFPGLFVGYRRSKRQEQVFLGLPDALDLMVVCVEAGLGLDAAMRKVCEEMAHSFPIISEEFSICNFQLQMGRPRREVLHDLGIRTGVDDMKSLAAILIQADRFGSSVAHALRVQSDAMRVRRRQLAEERAAKTAVQLLLPLVLFIFPAVFIVLVGPAGINVYDQLFSIGQ